MNKLVNILFFCLLFFIAWTDNLKLGQWIPFYMVFILLIFAFVVYDIIIFKKKITIFLEQEDIFLFLVFFILLLTSAIQQNDKTINYILAYIYVYFILYAFFKYVLFSYNISFEKLLNALTFGVLFACFYTVNEFILQILFSFDISDYMLRGRETTALYTHGIPRAYGTSTEPTVFSMYLITLAPIAIWNIFNWNINKILKYIFTIIVILAFIFTFSSAGILFISISLIITLFLFKEYFILLVITLCSIILIIILLTFFNDLIYLFENIYLKITLDEQFTSVRGRLYHLNLAIERISNNIFIGHGLGYLSSIKESSPMNYYLSLFIDGGIFAPLFFIMFLLLKLYNVFLIKENINKFFFLGLLAACLNMFTVSTFYNPFFWVLLILISIYKKKDKALK